MPSGLVVGADGRIGRALLAEIRAAGWLACGTTRREQKREGLIGLDLADSPDRFLGDARLETIAAKPPLAVFLLAAITGYKQCEANPAATRVVNVEHTVEIARQLMQRNAFVIFPSSSAVFGNSGAQAPGEDAAPQPTTEYGRQKAAAEQALAGAAIVRIAKVVGPDDRFGGWMKDLSAGKPIDAAPDLMLSPVSIHYVVRGMMRIAERRESGIYHLSGAQSVSYFQFARLLAGALGCDPALVHASPGQGISNSGQLDMGEASRRAGLEPQTLDSAVADLVTDFRERR